MRRVCARTDTLLNHLNTRTHVKRKSDDECLRLGRLVHNQFSFHLLQNKEWRERIASRLAKYTSSRAISYYSLTGFQVIRLFGVCVYARRCRVSVLPQSIQWKVILQSISYPQIQFKQKKIGSQPHVRMHLRMHLLCLSHGDWRDVCVCVREWWRYSMTFIVWAGPAYAAIFWIFVFRIFLKLQFESWQWVFRCGVRSESQNPRSHARSHFLRACFAATKIMTTHHRFRNVLFYSLFAATTK